jgi:hypothetical protein
VSVTDRWHKARPRPGEEKCRQHKIAPSADHGQGDRWQVRWRDEQGRQKKKAFAKKSDADNYDAKVKTQLADGTYIDESAGQVSFRAYAEDWRANRMHDPATAERIEGMLRNHVYSCDEMPGRTRGGGRAIGDYPLRVLAKRVTLIQGWIKA